MPECVCGGVILWLWGVWFNNLGVSGVFYMERWQTRRTPPCHAKSSRGACGFIQPRPALQPFGSFTGSSCNRSHGPQIERWGEWRAHITGYDANRGQRAGERRQGKVYKAAFIWVSQGHEGRRRDLSGFCVIVSPLIKVKGVSVFVSLCHRLLLDICSFQVEEMFKDWRLYS